MGQIEEQYNGPIGQPCQTVPRNGSPPSGLRLHQLCVNCMPVLYVSKDAITSLSIYVFKAQNY